MCVFWFYLVVSVVRVCDVYYRFDTPQIHMVCSVHARKHILSGIINFVLGEMNFMWYACVCIGFLGFWRFRNANETKRKESRFLVYVRNFVLFEVYPIAYQIWVKVGERGGGVEQKSSDKSTSRKMVKMTENHIGTVNILLLFYCLRTIDVMCQMGIYQQK